MLLAMRAACGNLLRHCSTLPTSLPKNSLPRLFFIFSTSRPRTPSEYLWKILQSFTAFPLLHLIMFAIACEYFNLTDSLNSRLIRIDNLTSLLNRSILVCAFCRKHCRWLIRLSLRISSIRIVRSWRFCSRARYLTALKFFASNFVSTVMSGSKCLRCLVGFNVDGRSVIGRLVAMVVTIPGICGTGT
jgi:hypothetical protein